MYILRMLAAMNFGEIASDDIMSAYMLMLPRVGVGRRLYTKTSPVGIIIVKAMDLTPYLNQLYLRIAEEPNASVEKLTAYLIADHCRFCDPMVLKQTIVRFKRRHASF